MRCFAQETLAISEKTHVKILQKLAKGTWEILGEVIQSNISISINIGITVYAAPMMSYFNGMVQKKCASSQEL